MPHGARKRSESGFYHVVPKGMGGQILFEDNTDRDHYLQLLGETKQEYDLRLHAYCLMSNHVHLVVEDPKQGISDAMKYVDERYGTYFATKTGRSDGIFRKPFWSEPIEREEYLLCAVRYAHANPANAGICKASAYTWSSAKDYLGRAGIADTSMVLDMCGGRKGFIAFSQPDKNTALPFKGSKLRWHMNDAEALTLAKDVLGYDPHELLQKAPKEREAAIVLLAERGFNKNQVMRISGLGRRVISSCFPRTSRGLPPSGTCAARG